jgi:hypothetical protein
VGKKKKVWVGWTAPYNISCIKREIKEGCISKKPWAPGEKKIRITMEEIK